jgi:hypothetical protein
MAEPKRKRYYSIGWDRVTEAEIFGTWAEAKRALKRAMGKADYDRIADQLNEPGRDRWEAPLDDVWWWILPLTDEAPGDEDSEDEESEDERLYEEFEFKED